MIAPLPARPEVIPAETWRQAVQWVRTWRSVGATRDEATVETVFVGMKEQKTRAEIADSLGVFNLAWNAVDTQDAISQALRSGEPPPHVPDRRNV